MTKQDKQRWAEFCAALSNEGVTYVEGRHTFTLVNELHRLNMRLHSLSERNCNGEGWYSDGSTHPGKWDEKDEARFEKSWDNAMAKVTHIFSLYGEFEVTSQGDPRGWGMFEAKSKKTGRVFRINW